MSLQDKILEDQLTEIRPLDDPAWGDAASWPAWTDAHTGSLDRTPRPPPSNPRTERNTGGSMTCGTGGTR
jgi:hypothetical protein